MITDIRNRCYLTDHRVLREPLIAAPAYESDSSIEEVLCTLYRFCTSNPINRSHFRIDLTCVLTTAKRDSFLLQST